MVTDYVFPDPFKNYLYDRDSHAKEIDEFRDKVNKESYKLFDGISDEGIEDISRFNNDIKEKTDSMKIPDAIINGPYTEDGKMAFPPDPASKMPGFVDQGKHYRFEYQGIKLDPYRIVEIYGVNDFAMCTIIKKALCCGNRGHKDFKQDLKDIICAAQRRLDMLEEDGEL